MHLHKLVLLSSLLLIHMHYYVSKLQKMRLTASEKKTAAKLPRNEEKLTKSEKDFNFLNSDCYRAMTDLKKDR